MKQVRKSDVVAAVHRLFQNEDFHIFIAYLANRHGFTRGTTFDPEPGRTAFNEGRRSVLVDIGTLQDMDPLAVKDLEDAETTTKTDI